MNDTKITTERLNIRPMVIEDSISILKYRSDKETNKYQSWIPNNISEVEQFIRNRVSPVINIPVTWFQSVIILKTNNELIGDIGIHFLDEKGLETELGCTLDKNYQGKGYAQEAMTEIINFLFFKLKKHRIIASIDPRNQPSIKLVERLGFRKEAHHVKSLFINNEWVDDLQYALIKSEWEK